MAAFVNDRTVLIMAATPRFAPPTDRGMFLTPSAAVFKVAPDGQSATPASFTFKVTLLNMSGTVTFSFSAGITPAVNGNEVTVTYANFAAVSGTITATLNVEGVVYTQVATLAKVADGASGAAGAQGVRGNVDIAAITTASIWSDTEAANALNAAGYGAPRSRDLVTLYKADRTFSVQKMYNGSVWVTVDYVYNGNMFIKGSILPEAIDTRGLTIKDASGNVILSSGTNLDKSRINANFGSNLLYNGDFSCGLDGWGFGGGNGPALFQSGLNLAGWWPSSAPGQPGANVFWANQVDAVRSSSVNDASKLFEHYGPKVPVEAGKNYIISAYTGAHRCVLDIFMYWYNSSDQLVAATPNGGATSGPSANAAETGGGVNLTGYKRIYDAGVAPVGAVYARPILRKYATLVGNNDSYMFVGRVMVEEAPPGVTTPGIWSMGQSVAPITTGNVSTYIQGAAIGLAQINKATIGSLSALTATIGMLRTSASGARTELSDNVFKVFDGNNILRVRIGDLSL